MGRRSSGSTQVPGRHSPDVVHPKHRDLFELLASDRLRISEALGVLYGGTWNWTRGRRSRCGSSSTGVATSLLRPVRAGETFLFPQVSPRSSDAADCPRPRR